ncbi:shikimate kinase [Fontivita pretiosa]|uniref:shikimate kinase n=1 Tax=Fontivita pretiosa TaxID=2989684 RepID=UPI003D18148D
MSAILLGYRGCGKTTIGRKLADRMWARFIDTDEMVVRSAGKSIREIFQQHGEPYFRELETQAIREALKLADHIIALGGGAVLSEQNRLMLKQSGLKRIYLRCEPQVLLERIRSDPQTAANRPNLTGLGGGIEEIQTLLAQREPLYREVATAELDVTNLSVEDAVVYITRLI